MKVIITTANAGINFIERHYSKFADGKPFSLELKPFRQPKSNDQNKLLHALIAELGDFLGYPASTMKDIVKALYGPMQTFELDGKDITVPKSVADYTSEDISALIDHIYRLGAEQGHVFQEQR